MKPLNQRSAKELLERIDNATNTEIRSLTLIDPTTMQLRLSVQDRNRGFDWIDIILEVGGVNDARLVDDAKLPFVDMAEGLSICYHEEQAGLGIGSYGSLEGLRDSTLFIIGSGIKYAEAEFSE